MSRSPRLQSPDAWEATVTKAADDYRSGLALIDQLGAFGLLDPALAGMLLAVRRGLIEETNAASTDELVLIDMARTANRWHMARGERVSRELCADCRRPIRNAEAHDMIDGNRIHITNAYDCLIRHGERWRYTATTALLDWD
jgi:hypothetical protein